jgi:hypothetical protein
MFMFRYYLFSSRVSRHAGYCSVRPCELRVVVICNLVLNRNFHCLSVYQKSRRKICDISILQNEMTASQRPGAALAGGGVRTPSLDQDDQRDSCKSGDFGGE